MAGTKQQSTNRSVASIDGVCGASWVWGVDRTNMGTFFVWVLVPHIPPQNNHFGSKQYHAAHQWQNSINTTIKWYSRTVFIGGLWPLANMTSCNISFGCNFFGTKLYVLAVIGYWESEGTNNNTQKDEISFTWYIRGCRYAHCNDLAVF